MRAEPSGVPQDSGSCGRWRTLTIQAHCREVLSLLADLSASLHPSITHLAATGTRKTQESLKPTGAHAWGCVWSNKGPSVCNSCSVSKHHLSSAETGFSGRNWLWQSKWRWYHVELGLHEQPWTWPSLMPRPEQGSGSSSGISGEAAAHSIRVITLWVKILPFSVFLKPSYCPQIQKG